MTLREVKEYFRTWYQITKQTNISRTSIHSWRKQGFIDIKMQLRIEKFTKGELKASLDDIPRIGYELPAKNLTKPARPRKKDDIG